MAIRTNTNPMRPDLQPEMRALLMRNGMQAHVVPVGDSYQLVVQGHDSPLLRYPISRQQMQALTDWGTNHANKKAYETFTDIVKEDFDMPRNFVHARNANGRVAMGLPARLSDESVKLVDYWNRELKENPCLIDAIESDVNNALEVIRKAERGEKIEYATYRNYRQTEQMREQMPKHFFVADEIKKHPDKENKTIVLVIDKQGKSADVILPAGASLEVNNEIKGMSKQRIQSALEKSGIEKVRFYNPDGALGYRPDDRYFAEKQIEVARLKNWALETLSTIDAHPAVKHADKPWFEKIQMVQDDKNRWALFIKPEGKAGYSVYPEKDDLNRFFITLKQSLDNIDKVRGELARKYYALAESKPDLKVDLFHTADESIDLNRIQRVAVFKTKNGAILCAPTIDNQKPQPRSVTPQQWQRMWVAEDRNSFKQHLAATLFADVLNKSQAQEQTSSEKQESEVETKISRDEEIKHDQPKEEVEEEEEVSKGMHR